jgi:hypothetical protein
MRSHLQTLPPDVDPALSKENCQHAIQEIAAIDF